MGVSENPHRAADCYNRGLTIFLRTKGVYIVLKNMATKDTLYPFFIITADFDSVFCCFYLFARDLRDFEDFPD